MNLSYCCTTNLGNIIKQHNSKVLIKKNENNNSKCNCRSTPNCPLNGEYLNQCLVFHPTTALFTEKPMKISSKHGTTTIQNLSDTTNAWMLSKHVWNIKDHGLGINLWWQIQKGLHHTSVGQNVAIYVCWKTFASFVLI